VGGLGTPYDHELDNVRSREYTVKIDQSRLPEDSTIDSMRNDDPLIKSKTIVCNDAKHYYLADLAKARVLDDGPIYCPGCDSFSSETPVNRRKRDYQESKTKCFHDYLDLLNEGRAMPFTCPRCGYCN
jgi:hypothetical protein